MPFGMRPLVLTVFLLLAGSSAQVSAFSWRPRLFASPLAATEHQVQQQQQRKLLSFSNRLRQQLPGSQAFVADSSNTLGLHSRQLLQEVGEPAAATIATGGGYSYGDYGYGGYFYGGVDAAGSGAGSRKLLAESSNGLMLAPLLQYTAISSQSPPSAWHTAMVQAAGMSHNDGIELPESTDPFAASSVFSLPSERKATRKLLVSASSLNLTAMKQQQQQQHVPTVMEAALLEPHDEPLVGPLRSLLTDGDGSTGGTYGYGSYEYGYGYKYEGTQAALTTTTGRSLLHVAADDDVQLYNLWVEQHNKLHLHEGRVAGLP